MPVDRLTKLFDQIESIAKINREWSNAIDPADYPVWERFAFNVLLLTQDASVHDDELPLIISRLSVIVPEVLMSLSRNAAVLNFTLPVRPSPPMSPSQVEHLLDKSGIPKKPNVYVSPSSDPDKPAKVVPGSPK